MSNSVETDPARTVTHPNGITQVFATRTEDRAPGEAAIGAYRRAPEWNAYATYAPDGSSLGTYADADGAYAAIVRAHEVRTGTCDSPLEHLDEQIVHDGAHWTAEGPRGALYVIKWFSSSGNVAAWKFPGRSKAAHRGRASSIEEARAEALRMAGLITDGKKG